VCGRGRALRDCLSASNGAIDACKQMGRRKFMDLLVEDTVQEVRGGISDERDVMTIKEYKQVRWEPLSVWRTREPPSDACRPVVC
jgi:hypothetical protein